MSVLKSPVEVDGDKLMQFVFRAVDEVGAALNAALVVMGDKLGLYRTLAERRASRRMSWPSAPGLPSAMCGNGWAPRQPGASSPMTPAAAGTRWHPSRRSR